MKVKYLLKQFPLREREREREGERERKRERERELTLSKLQFFGYKEFLVKAKLKKFDNTQPHKSNPDSTQPAHELAFLREKYIVYYPPVTFRTEFNLRNIQD